MNKPIPSHDPRKASILAALKGASNCRKVTTVKETDTHYTGNAMNPNPGGTPGFVSVEKSAVAFDAPGGPAHPVTCARRCCALEVVS